ncbi:MAG: asparaginase [Candidatus Nanopelagicaceae bacterium]
MNEPFQDEILVEVVRGGMVESVHHGRLLLVDGAGKDLLALGGVDQLIYPRSAIKTIQASAMVRAGLRLDPKELALVCASHAGSAIHQESALRILKSVGLDERALKNTPDKPLGVTERREWGDREATSLAANCSGKHAGMVATASINGWDIDSYKDPSHPLQMAIRDEFESLSGESIKHVSVDGCGAPLFAMTLRGVVRAIHAITHSDVPVHREVVAACTSFPEMVSGKGRVVTEAMERIPGLLVKDGAEGVMIASLPGSGTLCWKMSDGSNRGDRPLLSASLSHLGITLNFDQIPIYGDGKVVGEVRASKLLAYVAS